MLEPLIRHLRYLGIDLDATSIADSLWLAEVMRSSAPAGNPATNDAGPRPAVEASNQPELARTEPPTAATNQIGVHSLTSGGGTRRATRAYISTGRALPQALELARALRPFKKPFRNGARRELAVDATIDRYVETRLLTPVFDPVPERWFNVDIVVDQSLSMRVWQETVRDVIDLLRQTGAFRLVREWHLDVEDRQSLLRDINGAPVRPERLKDPQQRRLIVVISDCVSDGWYDPGTWTMLRTWLGSTHAVLLNPLPPKLWRHTALDLPAARLHGTVAGAAGTGLRFDLPAILRLRGTGRWLPLPIAGLSPFSLGQWARTVMGTGQDGCDGVLVPTGGRLSLDEDYDDGAELTDPGELVHAFRMTASPLAWRLAVLYSTQDTLPLGVMRLIQREMVPEAQVSDLAEVIVSGLFADATGSSFEEMAVAFVPGVADVLRAHLSAMDAWSVHDAVSAILERSAGIGRRMTAAVEHDDGELTLPDHLAPFAHAAAATLRLLEPQVHAARQSRNPVLRQAAGPTVAAHGRFLGIGNARSATDLFATRDLLRHLFSTEVLFDPVGSEMSDFMSRLVLAPQDGGALVVMWSGEITLSGARIRLLTSGDEVSDGVLLDDFVASCAGSGANQVLIIIDAWCAGTELYEARSLVREALTPKPNGSLPWCGLLMSVCSAEVSHDGVFGDRVRKLLREGPTAPESLRNWSRHSELIEGSAFGLALLQDWDMDIERPQFAQVGAPMALLPNPLHTKWQQAFSGSPDVDARQGQRGLQFDLLGPLRIRMNGEPIALPQGDAHTVLALLVADANDVVPFDLITEALSADRSTVHRHVLSLRDLLMNADPEGSATILATMSGYKLVVDPWRVDIHRVRELIGSAQGRTAAARAKLLGDALSLWRGVTLADVPGHLAFDRIEELRLTALEDRIAAELELGRRREVVGELRELVRDHPHRERFSALLAESTKAPEFDVALSATGDVHEYVRAVAQQLGDRGARVFYDEDERANLWGINLIEYLRSVYGSARLTIVFMSADYAGIALDTPERTSDFARAMEENAPHVLYVRSDDTSLHALPSSARSVDIRATPPAQLVGLILRRLSRDDDALPEEGVGYRTLARSTRARRMIVMITALDAEYAAVRAQLSGIRLHRHHSGSVFEVGQANGAAIALGLTGVGNTGAAALTERAIGEFEPAVVMFVGVAGGLRDWLQLGDVVVATRVYGYHGGRNRKDEFLARPRSWELSHYIEQLARMIARGQQDLTVHFQPIVSGEVVLNSMRPTLAQRIHQHFNDAVAVEIESAGVANAALLNSATPTVIVRGISDLVDDKSLEDGKDRLSEAARNAAAFAIELATALTTMQGASGRGKARPAEDMSTNIVAGRVSNLNLSDNLSQPPQQAQASRGPVDELTSAVVHAYNTGQIHEELFTAAMVALDNARNASGPLDLHDLRTLLGSTPGLRPILDTITDVR